MTLLIKVIVGVTAGLIGLTAESLIFDVAATPAATGYWFIVGGISSVLSDEVK